MPANVVCRSSDEERSFVPVVPGGVPVFGCTEEDYALFYAPRTVCVVPRAQGAATRRQIRRLWSACGCGRTPIDGPFRRGQAAAEHTVRAAQEATQEVAGLAQAAFAPECLTLFLNNACNLGCRYCHATPGLKPDRPISDTTLQTAGTMVAQSCARRGRPFMIVFHGGGEPSLDAAHADHILGILREIARASRVEMRTYIATNGVMPEARARWLADRFDLVGLSCDGPPDVQDAQRPARDGSPTAAQVGRTAMILRQAGRTFHLRATITAATVDRQTEIARFLADHYAPAEIRLEPVYANPTGLADLAAADAARFVANFMDARAAAAARGVPVTTSLTRPGELHGRYCHVLRQVLNLTPGDLATGCFLESRAASIERRGARVGAVNPVSGLWEMDAARIQALVARGAAIPETCRGCLCGLQCTYGCPDVCVLHQADPVAIRPAGMAGFRCQASRLLLDALIREAAEAAWRGTPPGASRATVAPGTRLRVIVFRDGSGEA